MNKFISALLRGLLTAFVTISFAACGETKTSESAMTVQSVLGNSTHNNFKKLYQPQPLTFPKDHGSHPEFQTEWWYVTGNLVAKNQRRFGYQLTFFRFGLEAENNSRESAWASNQSWMAHFALTDVANDKFYAGQKFSREALTLAGAQAKPFQVWLDDWKIEESAQNSNKCNSCLSLKLDASTALYGLSLSLNSVKPAVLNGNKGLSQKSAEPGNASMYYSLSRMSAQGQVRIGSETFTVEGSSWMDREWSTSVLAKHQTGWDWFSLQLEDGHDLMLYQIRKSNNEIDNASSGSLIDVAGGVKQLFSNDFEITVLDYWTSPHTKVDYPSKWRVRLPKENIELEVSPYINDQELNLAFRYWEGAVEFKGKLNGEAVVGRGYVELTGYQ